MAEAEVRRADERMAGEAKIASIEEMNIEILPSFGMFHSVHLQVESSENPPVQKWDCCRVNPSKSALLFAKPTFARRPFG